MVTRTEPNLGTAYPNLDEAYGAGQAADPLQSGIDRIPGQVPGDAGSPLYVADAPSDGTTYGRKDGGWIQTITYANLQAHIDDTDSAHAASAISFVPAGTISAITVQLALEELDTEKLAATSYTASDVLSKLLTVDGTASGLDADLLDGQHASAFATAGHNHDLTYAAIGHDHAALYSALGHGHTISEVTSLQAELDGKVEYLGVGNRDDLTLSYSSVTRKVTITGAADIWINGEKTTLSNPYEFTAHADVTGGYFFYFDENGDPQVGTDPWSITSHAPICYVFYDATLVEGIPFYELHDARRNPELHARMHFVDGTQVENGSGFTASGYTLNSDTNANKTLAISAGDIWDEDIQFTTAAVADGGPYTIFHRSGASGVWTWTKTASYPFLDDGTDIEYNQYTGATWQRTPLSGTQFMNMWVFATSSITDAFTILFVMGQTVHATQGAAEAESVGSLAWGTIPFQEIAPLYQITFRRANANGNQGKADIRRVARIAGAKSTVAQASVPPTTAAGVSFVAGGNISATEVQSAIEELDTEKLALAGGTMTGKLTTVASASGAAGLNLPHGAAPDTPSNGDVWTTTDGVYARVNGATVGPLGEGGTGTGGSPLTTEIVTATSQTGEAQFHYVLTNASLTNVTLPLLPSVGDTMAVTVANGRVDNTIEVTDEDVIVGATTLTDNDKITLDSKAASVMLHYVDATRGWRFV